MPLSTITSRFIHVVGDDKISFLFLAESYSIVYIYMYHFFIQLFMDTEAASRSWLVQVMLQWTYGCICLFDLVFWVSSNPSFSLAIAFVLKSTLSGICIANRDFNLDNKYLPRVTVQNHHPTFFGGTLSKASLWNWERAWEKNMSLAKATWFVGKETHVFSLVDLSPKAQAPSPYLLSSVLKASAWCDGVLKSCHCWPYFLDEEVYSV